MKKLNGYNSANEANRKNPVTKKQDAILEAIRYYFDDYSINPKSSREAFDEIGRYKERIEVNKNEIYIDGYLIKTETGITAMAPKFKDRIKENLNELIDDDIDYYSDYDEYDPTDMSTWDDDDWINFELEH